MQSAGISKHRNEPLSLGETFHRELGLVSSLNNERNTSGFPPQWESAFLFLSALQKQVVCFAFRSRVVFVTVAFFARPKTRIGKHALNLICLFR